MIKWQLIDDVHLYVADIVFAFSSFSHTPVYVVSGD